MSDRPRVGVDVGGTFTDLVAVVDGRILTEKVASTPAAPERGVVAAIEAIAEEADEVDPERVGFFAHGTTVATNAVLEGDWAETALVTTEGFRDALEIGRQDRPSLYDLRAEKPVPVVAREHRHEVTERLDERGEVLRELEEADVEAVASELADSGVESVAVTLLFAYENPDHERRIERLLRESGVEGPVSLSSDVLPEVREYERTLVTSLNAALRPVMEGYVGALDERLREAGLETPLRVMGSNAGVMSAEAARERPVETLLSGPAAGVRGATHVATRAGVGELLTMDMGGTSCDVSLVRDGDPLVSTEVTVGEYPVGLPMVDVHTVGAGGGSIAYLDSGNALRVGPRSAGADPGPICYGRGGTDPTVTDAHLALGRIDPESFLGDVGGAETTARSVFESAIADPLDRTLESAATGVLDVANATMARALRVVSVERGHDPREFTLVTFGGAGPLHATALAAEIGVPRVLVPRAAGVLSALGLLVSDLTYDESVSRIRPWSEVDPATVVETFSDLESRARARLGDADVDDVRVERSLDVRYRGQSFDLPVAVDRRRVDTETVASRFHAAHERRYGHASPGEPLELVTVRVRVRGVVEPPSIGVNARSGRIEDARRQYRDVWFDADVHETPVYRRELLPLGVSTDGPAIVEGAESTLVVRPDDTVSVDEHANLLVEVGP